METQPNTELSEEEKAYLREMLTAELKHMRKDGKTLIVLDTPRFLAAEEKLEEFLERMIKKLQ